MSIENLAAIEHALHESVVPPRILHQIWEQRRPIADKAVGKKEESVVQIPWIQSDIELAHRFAQKALRAEEYLLVCDLGREVARLGDNVDGDGSLTLLRIRMLHAQALARLGATREARALLDAVTGQTMGPRVRAQLLSLIGDIIREESHHVPARAARLEALQEALGFYAKSRAADPSRIDTLIVSAGVARILGDRQSATRDAEATLHLVAEREMEAGRTIEGDIARAAALAVLGKLDEAAEAYSKLKDSPGQTTALLAEARYRAQFLAEAAGCERDFFKPAFPPLQLLIFAGHLPSPDDTGRFPLSRVAEARSAIRACLAKLGARAGLGSAAAGGDLLFVDELFARNAAVHVVLPWAREEFRKTSVLCSANPAAPEPAWDTLFETALKKATSIRELGQLYQPSDETGWQYMSEVACGVAILTARAARLDLKPVVLWDGQDGPSGGTASFVKFWTRFLGEKPEIVDLRAPVGHLPQLDSDSGRRTERSLIRQEVKSMLFADIVGYSRLTEKVIPEFIRVFMPRVAQLTASSRHAPISVNTWGDAVYAVFDFATDAGCFALELVQMIRDLEAEWLRTGLYWEEVQPDGSTVKRPLNVRVGLHTGPVFFHHDPIVRRLNYTGAHVNRAARIEPVARPGEVYASEEFAAMAALDVEIDAQSAESPEAKGEFVCEYAGTMPLAKGYPGRYRIYRVLPKKTLDIEVLARAIHDDYCEQERIKGLTPESNPSMVPWDLLPDDLKEANRAQAGDIPNKLRMLGYELSPLHGIRPGDIEISAQELDVSARREHDRWSAERQRQGWIYGPVRDNARKHHPLLVPWEDLNEAERQKDRDAVLKAVALLAGDGDSGFRLRKIAGS